MTWMVNHHPQDGHRPFQGWSPTIQNVPLGSVLQTLNSAHRLDSQNEDQVKCQGWSATIPTQDGHQPSKGWSPTIPNLHPDEFSKFQQISIKPDSIQL